MHYVDLPSAQEVGELNLIRSDACVSIYLPTTPVSRETEGSRIALGNLVREAARQLEEAGFDKRRLWPLLDQFDDLLADTDFWSYQAHSLAILATPDWIRTWRMANKLTEMVEVSDRFHIKPLLRALTFPQAAHVLAVSENGVRVIEITPDLPPAEISVANMPRDAAAVGGTPAAKDYTGWGHRRGVRGEDFYRSRYVREIDAALRPVLSRSELPVVLAAAQPLQAFFRSMSSLPFVPEGIVGNPDHLKEQDLEKAARPIIEAHNKKELEQVHRLFDLRRSQQRVTTDLSDAARLATFGGLHTLLIDIDSVLDGYVDEESGVITLDDKGDAANYGVVDEIAGLALRTGARVLAVRRADIPGNGDLAAITRYPI